MVRLFVVRVCMNCFMYINFSFHFKFLFHLSYEKWQHSSRMRRDTKIFLSLFVFVFLFFFSIGVDCSEC
jgi:hypothetical protein